MALQSVAAPAATVAAAQPAGLALSYTSFVSPGSVEITYVLPQDAERVFVGIWNHFAFHVKTLVNDESQKAGRHTVVWDGTDRRRKAAARWHVHVPDVRRRPYRRKRGGSAAWINRTAR